MVFLSGYLCGFTHCNSHWATTCEAAHLHRHVNNYQIAPSPSAGWNSPGGSSEVVEFPVPGSDPLRMSIFRSEFSTATVSGPSNQRWHFARLGSCWWTGARGNSRNLPNLSSRGGASLTGYKFAARYAPLIFNNLRAWVCSQKESVDMALNLLDGYDVRGRKIKIERARFTMKGEAYDPNLKPKKKRRKDKEKIKKMQER